MRYLFGLWCFLVVGLAQSADMVRIPAGPFLMGCTQSIECEADEGPPGGMRVFVPSFAIDPYEVTVAEYRACVAKGQCRPPKTHALNQYCNYDAPGRDAYPVNCVDWPDAVNYCTQHGKRLPLEAEWEKAARGGSTSAYIWGGAPDCSQAIMNDGKTVGAVRGEFDGCGEDRTWAVGTRRPNAYGLYDMLGNVSEWVQNWYHPDALRWYAQGQLQAPKSGTRKVIRGGAWDEVQVALRSASRFAKTPRSGKSVWGSNGFRCAKDDATR
jgi:formylglycine-generating enzyme